MRLSGNELIYNVLGGVILKENSNLQNSVCVERRRGSCRHSPTGTSSTILRSFSYGLFCVTLRLHILHYCQTIKRR